MKLVVQEFLTLDGVSQGPGSPDEDPSDGFERGGWFVPHLDDALRLVIAPVVVGQGRHLFPDGGTPVGLRLVSHQTTPRGLSAHTYETTGRPQFGTYGADA